MTQYKILLHIILTGLICSSFYSQSHISTVKNKPVFVEAEKGIFEKLELREDTSASGNKYLKMVKTGNVRWDISVKSAGYYRLEIGYRTTEGDKEEYLIRNSKKIAIGLASSAKWNEFETYIRLNKGKNNLTFAPGWGGIDIDYIQVDKVHILPEIKPKNNLFYKDNPTDISLKVNLYEEQIKSISSGGKEFSYSTKEYPYQDDAFIIKLPKEELQNLSSGNHLFNMKMTSGAEVQFNLNIEETIKQAGLTIIEPHIGHGASTLFMLPGNKVMLVDCGQDHIRDSVIIPLLNRQGIKKIDYFFISHYHDDHDSGDKGEKIKTLYHVENFYDYKSFSTGDTFNLSGVNFKILNSYKDGDQENLRSLSFKMEYNGFVYVHGGDTYGLNQERILKDFPEDIVADVFHANHHFHGSVDVKYLRDMNPELVIIQAQEAIYARSAYMDSFKKDVVRYLIEKKKRFAEELPALEVGTVIIRVNDKNNWTYETYGNTSNNKIDLF